MMTYLFLLQKWLLHCLQSTLFGYQRITQFFKVVPKSAWEKISKWFAWKMNESKFLTQYLQGWNLKIEVIKSMQQPLLKVSYLILWVLNLRSFEIAGPDEMTCSAKRIPNNWIPYLLFALRNCCLSASIAFSASLACCRVRSNSCCSADSCEDARSAFSLTSRNSTSRSSFSWKHNPNYKWAESTKVKTIMAWLSMNICNMLVNLSRSIVKNLKQSRKVSQRKTL